MRKAEDQLGGGQPPLGPQGAKSPPEYLAKKKIQRGKVLNQITNPSNKLLADQPLFQSMAGVKQNAVAHCGIRVDFHRGHIGH